MKASARTAGTIQDAFVAKLRPDGSAIDPFMPWQMTARMTDVELGALYRFFQSLPESAPKG